MLRCERHVPIASRSATGENHVMRTARQLTTKTWFVLAAVLSVPLCAAGLFQQPVDIQACVGIATAIQLFIGMFAAIWFRSLSRLFIACVVTRHMLFVPPLFAVGWFGLTDQVFLLIMMIFFWPEAIFLWWFGMQGSVLESCGPIVMASLFAAISFALIVVLLAKTCRLRDAPSKSYY
jgi:hypothetical protein